MIQYEQGLALRWVYLLRCSQPTNSFEFSVSWEHIWVHSVVTSYHVISLESSNQWIDRRPPALENWISVTHTLGYRWWYQKKLFVCEKFKPAKESACLCGVVASCSRHKLLSQPVTWSDVDSVCLTPFKGFPSDMIPPDQSLENLEVHWAMLVIKLSFFSLLTFDKLINPTIGPSYWKPTAVMVHSPPPH